MSSPENFLRVLGVFDEVRSLDGEAEAEMRIKAAFGVVRRLRARFRRALEPPRKIVYIGEGNFVMTVDMDLSALTPTETRLELVMQVSASFLVESALNYRINLALEDFGTRLQEAVVSARAKAPTAPAPIEAREIPAATKVPEGPEAKTASAEILEAASPPSRPVLPEPKQGIEDYSERLADILVVSELLLNSKHLGSFRAKLKDPGEIIAEASKKFSEKDYLYITASIPSKGYLARILAWKGRIIAVTLEAGGTTTKGRKALEKLREMAGETAEISILEPPRDTLEKILG